MLLKAFLHIYSQRFVICPLCVPVSLPFWRCKVCIILLHVRASTRLPRPHQQRDWEGWERETEVDKMHVFIFFTMEYDHEIYFISLYYRVNRTRIKTIISNVTQFQLNRRNWSTKKEKCRTGIVFTKDKITSTETKDLALKTRTLCMSNTSPY